MVYAQNMAADRNDPTTMNLVVNGRTLSNLEQLPHEIFSGLQELYKIDLSKLELSEKARLVRELDKAGFMAMRNAVNILARRFGVTRACIYNWIKYERQAER